MTNSISNRAVLAFALSAPALNSSAQSGSLDIGFNPGSGANNTIFYLALQSNGQILAGGLFTNFNGQSHNRIVRLNSEGGLDENFGPLAGPNGAVRCVASETNGGVYIGGTFTSVNGILRNYFARLRADGSLDLNYPRINFDQPGVFSIEKQSDGKLLVIGTFTSVNNGIPRRYIARITAAGTLEPV